MKKEMKNKIEEYLNERYVIMTDFNNPPDKVHYEGVLKGLEMSGIIWVRDKNGKHKVL